MGDTVSDIGVRGTDVRSGYTACVLTVDGSHNAEYAHDYLHTFGTTGQVFHTSGDSTKEPQGQTYVSFERSITSLGALLRIEHQYLWQRTVYTVASTQLPVKNILTPPTIHTFLSDNPMASLAGTAEYSRISFDIDSEYCGHCIDKQRVNGLKRGGCCEAVAIQKASSQPFWTDDEGVRSVDIYISVHSSEATIFKNEFMAFWNYQRKERITDMSMTLGSHPSCLCRQCLEGCGHKDILP